MNQRGRLLFLDTSNMCQEGDAHSGTFGSRFPTTQTLQVRKGKKNTGQRDAKAHSLREEVLRLPAPFRAEVSQGGHLDVENVVEDAVELLVQQRLHSVLDVGLPFFVMFASVQT